MAKEIVKGEASVRSDSGAATHSQKHVPKAYTNGTSNDTFVFSACEMTIAQRISRPGEGVLSTAARLKWRISRGLTRGAWTQDRPQRNLSWD